MISRGAAISLAGLNGLAVSAILTVTLGGPSNSVLPSTLPEVAVISADYPNYESPEQLVDTATDIIQGSVIDSRVELVYPEVSDIPDPRINPQYGLSAEEIANIPPVVTTVFTLQVDEVFKGDEEPGGRIEVSQLGGSYAGVHYVMENAPLDTVSDNTYVLALNEHGDSPYGLLNPEQAAFVATGDRLVSTDPSGGIDISSTNELTDLVTE